MEKLRLPLFFIGVALAFMGTPLGAQTPRDFAIDLSAVPSTNSPCLTLNWTIRRQGNITAQKIHRRLKGETTWVKLSDLATNQTSYADATAAVGVEYEYWMERSYSGISPSPAMGYLSAGVNVPWVEGRGKLLLVVDSTMAAPLAPEIAQLQSDLAGDGWTVQTITAARTDTAVNTKALIKAAYDADPANLKMVYLLGHVPVPYSGSLAPDGHSNHVGAWPADGYYGDMDGNWTDTSINNTSAGDARNRNIPGDGKFDQSSFPSRIELMVGRVDLSNMTRAPAAIVSETALLRRYLRKAHDFRFSLGAYGNIPRRSLVRDGFGYFSGENFAMSGWAMAFTGVGQPPAAPVIHEPPSMQWFSPSYAGGQSYLMGHGNGGGSWDTASSVGNSVDFGLETSRVVFTSLFGSYFGDWDCANNFLRAPLAGNATGDSLGLVCYWTGRPNWFTHHLGMGETFGYCARLTQNGTMSGGGGYTPGGYSSAGVHVGLMGDPALRLHAVEPPRNLAGSSANTQNQLVWSPSSESNLVGYLVYRAAAPAGPFARLTADPLSGTSYADAAVTAGQSYSYLVRTLKLDTVPGGSYYNLSVGSPLTLTASAAAGAAPRNPSSLTVTQASATNALITWADNASDETGYRIERKTNAGGSYAAIGTVGTSVTNFTDPGVFTQGNVYYYRVVATGAAGDSPPSNEASFDAVAGFFDLPSTRMKVNKTAGAAVITVNRIGGVTGPVSVNFATSDTSAIAGTHYTAVAGTLTWADGDAVPKSISVPLINTAAPQAARQFKVTLSGPSSGTSLTINTYAAVLIEDPTATLGAPWSQTVVSGITDSSPAVTEAGSISSVTIGGSGVSSTATTDAGQFIYQSRTGDGVLTAYFPAGAPGDGNARHVLMVRSSTANNAIMAAAVTCSSTSFGTKLVSRTTAGGSAVETPSTANTMVLPRWMRLIRSGSTYSAETSVDGSDWVAVGTASFTNLPPTAVWGFFHYSSDWSVTALGNYHLAQVQNMTLTALPPPPAPSGLTAVPSASRSVLLRWNSSSFASGYRIERCTEASNFVTVAGIVAGSGTNQTYTNTGLDVNTAYGYRVVATNAVGESAPSAPAYASTPADTVYLLTTDGAGAADAAVRRDLPDVPLGTQTNLTLAGYDSKSYTLLAGAAKSYLRFNLGSVGAFSSAQLRLASLGQTNAFRSGYFYLYVDQLDESSDTWDEGTITWANAPQNNLVGYDFTGNTVSLGFYYGGVPPAAGETLALDLDADGINSNRGANNLITIGLSQYYDITEWASREHPSLPPPTLELVATTNIPPRASFLTAAPGTGWSISLRWQDSATNETGFTLERREGAGAFSVLQTLGSNSVSFWDSTTQPGVTYTYRVRSFNAVGPSDWTPEVTLTAATLENAVSTVWDGGGADTLISTPTNWDFNTRPAFDGSATVTIGTGGSTATVNTNVALCGVVINRDAAFTLADGGGTLTLGAAGLTAAVPTANSRTYALGAKVALASNQTWSVTNNGAGVATVTVSGSIGDGGAGFGITKAGNGVLALTASNSFSGVATVNNGQLAVSHASALGSTNGNTVVRSASGGYLQVSGGITVAEPLTLNGERPGSGSSLLNSSGSNVWSGPITRQGQTRLNSSGGSTLVIAGGMTGGGGLCVINSGGTIAFYGKPLSIGTDQFYLDSGGLTVMGVAGNVWGDTLVAGGTLRMDVANGLPAATVLKIGVSYSAGGTFDLNGFSQTVGQLRNETTNTGTRVVTSAKPAVLTVNQSVDSVYDGRLTGALSLVKNGTGTLALSNTLSTTTGDITVNGGTLVAALAASLGNSTNITVAGGTLVLQSAGALTNTACLSIADGAKVQLAAGILQSVDRLYLGGVRKGRGIWGATGSGADYVDDLHFAGGGRVYVSNGLSTYWDGGGADTRFSTGDNWDLDTRPALDGSALLLFATGGAMATVNTNAALWGLFLNRDADFTFGDGGGSLALGGGGLCAVSTAAVSRTYTVAAPVSLAADQAWGVTNTGAGAAKLWVSGPVSDGASSFGIAKSGNGILELSGDSSYDGATSVASGGVLRVTHGNALGSTNGATSVALGAWLEVGGSVAVPEPLTITADGTSGSGNLRSTDGTNVWGGRVTQTGVARIRALSGSRLTLAGGVTGSYNIYLVPEAGAELVVAGSPLNLGSTSSTRFLYANGAGVVALGVAGNTFGTLEVAGLTLRTDAPNALPAAAILALGSSFSPSGTFDLNGNSQAVSQLKRGITTSGARVVTSATPATLTVSGTTSTTYDGQLAGALSFTKAGTSTLTLNGANNTYSGATTVSGGTLDVMAGSGLGNSARVSVTAGTLRLRGSGAIPDSAVLLISDGGAKVRVDSGTETVGVLYLGGKRQRRGTYGASTSGAQYTTDTYFITGGTGVLNVLHGPESVILVQ